jgi:hypothetical protein
LQFESSRVLADALGELEEKGGKRPKTLTVDGRELDLEGMRFADIHELMWAGVRLIHRIYVGE